MLWYNLIFARFPSTGNFGNLQGLTLIIIWMWDAAISSLYIPLYTPLWVTLLLLVLSLQLLSPLPTCKWSEGGNTSLSVLASDNSIFMVTFN